MSELKEKIIENIKKVFDPEIPVNIYELGLIYDIKIDDGDVEVVMTLTSPCLLYTSPSPRDGLLSRMPSSA